MENAITVALELGSQGVTVARDPTGTRRGGQSSMWGQCPFFDSLPILTCKFHCPPIDNRMPAHPAPGSVSQSAPKSSDSVPGSGFGSGSGNQSARNRPGIGPETSRKQPFEPGTYQHQSKPPNRKPANPNREPIGLNRPGQSARESADQASRKHLEPGTNQHQSKPSANRPSCNQATTSSWLRGLCPHRRSPSSASKPPHR